MTKRVYAKLESNGPSLQRFAALKDQSIPLKILPLMHLDKTIFFWLIRIASKKLTFLYISAKKYFVYRFFFDWVHLDMYTNVDINIASSFRLLTFKRNFNM